MAPLRRFGFAFRFCRGGAGERQQAATALKLVSPAFAQSTTGRSAAQVVTANGPTQHTPRTVRPTLSLSLSLSPISLSLSSLELFTILHMFPLASGSPSASVCAGVYAVNVSHSDNNKGR